MATVTRAALVRCIDATEFRHVTHGRPEFPLAWLWFSIIMDEIILADAVLRHHLDAAFNNEQTRSTWKALDTLLISKGA